MNKAVVGGLVVLFLGALPLCAATIEVGHHVLLPDTPDQEIEIWVVPGDPVEQSAGMDVFAQIADGGPDIGIPGSHIDGPTFSGVNLLVDTVFNVDVDGDNIPDGVATPTQILAGEQVLIAGIVLGVPETSVDARGMLMTLLVDTTGFFEGDPNDPWDLRLTETLDNPTTLLNASSTPGSIPLEIINGTISIPEPSTIAMLLGLVGISLVLSRKRKLRG